MSKSVNKRNPVGEHGRDITETLFAAERLNKKAGRKLPRELLASVEQSLQEFRSLLDTGKQETKTPRDIQKDSAVKRAGRLGDNGREIQKFETEPQDQLARKV